uniref:Zinc finger protein 16-like n=1 Tax=Echeneis naucrates TaxID=173247 RepID=A0A665TL95_ECHNA
MDGGAPAAITEDGAGQRPLRGHPAAEDTDGPSAEDPPTDRVGVFCCQDCGEAFREEAVYLEHRQQHLQENVHLGDQLDGLHDAKKDRETVNFCTLCSLSFSELSDFLLHMQMNHSQTSKKGSGIHMNSGITKQQTYECQDCGKCYGVIGHFLNHQRSHRQASKSVFHDLEHLKKKSFQCESCGRNYSRASALDAHRRCHEEKLVKSRNRSSGDSFHTEDSVVEKPSEGDNTSEKPFKCSCGKAFSALLRLKTHQRFSRNSQCTPEEMKEKPKKNWSKFHCKECKKSFNGHIALFNHQRWHANHSDDSAKRFPCEECGKVFMTLTFYYRHQRMAHSDETPAKSFLHQVCQLQKKAFECKDCGLKFSRESALHSHQLHHTDVFRETEKEAQVATSLPQQKRLESERKETDHLEENVELERAFPTNSIGEDMRINETEEDLESYEPGDFNVQVISASESEDESTQDPNPDLELLCESDQEVRDDGDTEVSHGSLVSKPEMDLKIVQIDFEQDEELCAQIARETDNETIEERFDCPECYRWFSSASSLRVHRMWHGVHKRRQQSQGQSVAVYTCDICGHESSGYTAHCSHMQQHKAENPSINALNHTEGLEKKSLTCSECGKCFSRLSALVSHQLRHPKRKKFQCPDCTMSYLHATSLFNHMKNCSAHKKENISGPKKEYNPKKTLLGPKIYHCELCGKGFWSLGAYSHHKQNQTECSDLRLRKGLAGSVHSGNGHSRSSIKVACPVCGRTFRHKGIMALHMRKHENGNHVCELCNRSFRLFSSLIRHQVVHNDQLLPPPIKSFQHQVEQLKKNTYSCPDCGKLFSRAKALQFHMKSHGYETGHLPSSPKSTVMLEDLQCATCLAHFSNKASLRAHQKLCMKRDSQAVDCKAAPAEITDTVKLHKDGMDISTQEKSDHLITAQEINKMDIGELKTEAETDITDLKYKCNKCDRSFSVVGALNFHKRIHTEANKSVTKAKLSMPVMLKKPKQVEPSKGLFHCSECGRRFMSNSALGSHKRWHKEGTFSRSSLKDGDLKSVSHKMEDGPFQCNMCGKQFFNHCVLQRHQMFNPQCQTKTESATHSRQKVANNSTQAEKYSCSECKKSFSKVLLLATHYENEHGKTRDRQGDELVSVDHVPEQIDVSLNRGEFSLSTMSGKVHQCPECSMIFAKARGLRAHKWQVHSNSKNKGRFRTKKSIAMSSEFRNTKGSLAAGSTMVTNSYLVKKTSPVDRPAPSPVKHISCLDCGKLCSSARALLDHKKVCLGVKQEATVEIQAHEATAEVSVPLSRLSEHTVKCLFKCDKCGKAFQTEEQLSTHKTKAKSRPYCCALCCHGFWTENQLQQHLAWHDEVRCRLPNELNSAALCVRIVD